MENRVTQVGAITALPGAVTTQYVRCGKPGCRCKYGQRHGPYYYRIWRDGERVQKQYVRQADVESVRAACAAYRPTDYRWERPAAEPSVT